MSQRLEMIPKIEMERKVRVYSYEKIKQWWCSKNFTVYYLDVAERWSTQKCYKSQVTLHKINDSYGWAIL